MKNKEFDSLINEHIKNHQGCSCALILKDLEDKEIYPVFFKSREECEQYQKNIISEMKVKVLYHYYGITSIN
jgi:hypothetical protein